MKVREELESAVADGAIVLAVLERLGLEIWFRYEKDREEYACEGAIVALDDTPVGTFVEVEGEASVIVEMTTRLGRSPDDYIADSYRSLFTQYCRHHGIERTHMLFDQAVEG